MGRAAIIIGAGLTGLSVAFALRRKGADVTVLERGGRAGGAVRTERSDGFLLEHGPNSMMVTESSIEALIADAGLAGEVVRPLAKKRFLVRGNRPVALPGGPIGAVTTPLFSLGGKLRILAEPFVARGTEEDETLAGLVRRRLGPEMLAYAIEPFVAGVYAGDPELLSAKYAFPKLWNLERNHGSFIRGAFRLRKSGPPQSMLSFRDGMETLPARLAASLGGGFRPSADIVSIARMPDGWRVAWREKDVVREAAAPALVCAVPAFAVGDLPWPESLRGMFAPLGKISYPAVNVVALGFRRRDVEHPLDGFGALVPAAERRHILGAIFSSSLFPGRAPEGHVLLTVFVGGSRQPRQAALGDDALEKDVLRDLRDLLGVRGDPVFRRIIRWPRAIPQYNTGYGGILQSIEAIEASHPGLHLAGNYRGGIAAGQCLHNGLSLGARLCENPVSL